MSIQYGQPEPSLSFQAGDPIAQLPVDKTPPNMNEIHIIDTLFKKHRRTIDVIFEEAKDALIVGLLIITFCLPQVDTIIKKIPCAAAYRKMIVQMSGSTLDGLNVSKRSLRFIDFQLVDSSFRTIPLRGNHFSFSIVFVKKN